MRYYHMDGEDLCYHLDHYRDLIRRGIEKEIIIAEQKRDFGGPMWCHVWGKFVETKWSCGKLECRKYYEPRNGKSGRCKNLVNGFTATGRIFRLTKEGLKPHEQ